VKIRWPARPLAGVDRGKLAGGLGAIAIASIVYSQFSIYGWLKRDSAIYMYGGQQMLHGRPPYASIMDPKGPLAGIISGFGSGVAQLLGRDDVLVIRVEFCAISILTVLAVYLLALELWQSVVAGLVAAVVFTSFAGFARDALVGPNGHTPGIFFLVVSLWLTVRRHWFWAGFAAALAFLVWQPLFPYPLVTLVCAAVWTTTETRRQAVWRSIWGGLTPFLALVVYYAAEGDLGKLFEGLFVFPLTGVTRNHVTLFHRIHLIFSDVQNQYGFSGDLLWIGIVLLVVAWVLEVRGARREKRKASASPVVLLLGLTFVVEVLYAVYDYQGYSHAFPLLPYGALGWAVAAVYLLRRLAQQQARQTAVALLLTAVAVATIGFAVDYYQSTSKHPPLRGEQASACAVQRSLVPGTPLWVMGNPLPLVLLHRRNPDNYPYLGSGLDHWKIKHTKGHFRGWTKEVVDSRASIVLVDTWQSPVRHRMERWLSKHGYLRGFIGPWQVFVTPAARARMPAQGVALAAKRSFWPRTSTDTRFTVTNCVHG
jgi:hypothetical protein